MTSMFYNCKSLVSLDLRNFNTSLVTDMKYMFFKCKSLINLNLISFTENQLSLTTTEIFDGINNTLIYCINET
jgi:surface protein